MDVMLIVATLIIGNSLLFDRRIKSRKLDLEATYIMLIFLTQLAMMLASLTRELAASADGFGRLVKAMDYLCYLFTVVALLFLTLYIIHDLRQHAFINNTSAWVMGFVCGVIAIIWTVGFFQSESWFISYTPNGDATYSGAFDVMHLLLALVMAFDLMLAQSCFKQLPPGKLRSWLLITAAPIVASLCAIFVKGFPSEALFSVSSLVLYIDIYMSQSKRMAISEKELAESKTRLMISQIQPHFIYNSLNTIYYLIEQDQETAQEAVSTFSDYLRQNINSLKDDKPVKFEEELSHINAYLYLECLRFGEDLKIERDIKASDFYIPPLTVQPLVENAIKHGVSVKEGGGTVRIEAFETEDAFKVVISDDGVGFEAGKFKDSSMNTHIGLFNVNSRLKTMCGGDLQVTSIPGEGTRCEITLPKGLGGN